MATPPLIYVAGSAHGGSTLLDLLISGHSSVLSLGEANNLGRSSQRCSCGASTPLACPFWQAVSGRLKATHGLTLAELDPNARGDEEFRRHNAALFESVGAESGAALLLDSSKSPRRLRRLLETGFTVRPLHLVRSPYGVAYSYVKRGGRVGKPARVYVREHRMIAATLRERDHLRIRYERLSQEPEAELRRIMDWLELDHEPAQLDIRAGERHNWGGNGMRFRGSATIRIDEAWREGLSPWQKLLVGITTIRSRAVTSTRWEEESP